MNGRAVADSTFPPNGPIGICDSAEGLYAIKDSGKELIICQRLIPFDMSEWLKNIAPSQIPDFRILVRPVDVREAIKTQLDECGMPSGSGRDLFIGDIAKLVSIYAQITQRDLVDVRLDRIENDACRKFHNILFPAFKGVPGLDGLMADSKDCDRIIFGLLFPNI